MRPGLQIVGLISVVVMLTMATAFADGVPPLQVQINEREPDVFVVQWRVPPMIPAGAEPRPILPHACEPESPPFVTETPGGRLYEQVYRCANGLAGQTVAIDDPLAGVAMTALIRVELLSGDRYAHAFAATEMEWTVPDVGATGLAGALTRWHITVMAGLRHALAWLPALLLAVAMALFGPALRGIWLVTTFALGQLVGVGLSLLAGPTLPHELAALSVALAVVFLAREARRADGEVRRSSGIVAAAGLAHGLTLTTLPSMDSWPTAMVFVVGMDAALLALMLMVTGLTSLVPSGRPARTINGLVGALAVAAVVVVFVSGPGSALKAEPPPPLPIANQGPANGARAGRIAPSQADAPIQSFVTVEPFEVRHEVLLRLRDFVGLVGIEGDSVDVTSQDAVIRELSALVAGRTELAIDDLPVEGIVERAGFVTVDVTGVLPRTEPVVEAVATAVVGVTLIHPAPGMPNSITVGWTGYDDASPAIPTTIVDPEATLSGELTTANPTLSWENTLLADPLPIVKAVAVSPTSTPVPLMTVAILLLAALLAMAGPRWRVPTVVTMAAPRLLVAVALIAGPLAQITIALPGQFGTQVTPTEARRVLGGLLPTIYRAFEYRDEARVHDRLAVAVTGDVLTTIYLEQRQALVMQERGGARARAEAIELLELDEVVDRDGGGFTAHATWTVSGTVSHFGHRHFRQNKYDARVGVVPVAGQWKIASIEVLALERIR